MSISLSKIEPGRYATADGRFTVTRKDHPLLGPGGSRVTWIVVDTTGALPFEDSLGGPVADCWVGTLGEARAAIAVAAAAACGAATAWDGVDTITERCTRAAGHGGLHS